MKLVWAMSLRYNIGKKLLNFESGCLKTGHLFLAYAQDKLSLKHMDRAVNFNNVFEPY